MIRRIIPAAVALAIGIFAFSAISHAADATSVLSVLAKEKRGQAYPIADPKNEMNKFYAALSRSAAKKAGAITRVAHFGDSLIEMDLLSCQARRRLQIAFGDAGHGFIHVAKPKTWYFHEDVDYSPSAEWISYQFNDPNSPLKTFGLGGAISVAYKAKARAEIGTVKRGPVGTSVSRFEILTLDTPDGGPVSVALDGDEAGILNTRSNPPKDGFVRVKAASGRHELRLTARDPGAKLLGVVMENDGPGVVYDALGINGIAASALLRLNRAHWEGQIKHRDPDLVILGFGTNESTDAKLDIASMKLSLKNLIARVREALPNASIVLMAPLDRAQKSGANLVTMPNIPKIAQAQKEVAAETGVAFWNTFEAMGASGAMARWYAAKPRLCSGDFMHPTREGAVVLGDLWFDALAAGFEAYLRANGVAENARPRTPDPLVEGKLSK